MLLVLRVSPNVHWTFANLISSSIIAGRLSYILGPVGCQPRCRRRSPRLLQFPPHISAAHGWWLEASSTGIRSTSADLIAPFAWRSFAITSTTSPHAWKGANVRISHSYRVTACGESYSQILHAEQNNSHDPPSSLDHHWA
jgi:hypothetical protein